MELLQFALRHSLSAREQKASHASWWTYTYTQSQRYAKLFFFQRYTYPLLRQTKYVNVKVYDYVLENSFNIRQLTNNISKAVPSLAMALNREE